MVLLDDLKKLTIAQIISEASRIIDRLCFHKCIEYMLYYMHVLGK